MSQLTDVQIQQLINRYIRGKLDSWENKRLEGKLHPSFEIQDDLEQLEDLISDCKFELMENQLGSAGGTIQKIFESAQIPLPPERMEFNKICREYLKSAKKMYLVEKNRIDGEYDDDIEKIFPLNIQTPEPPKPSKQKSIPLGQLVEEYWKRKQSGWGGAAEESYERYSRRLLEHFGESTPIDSIDYESMAQFRDKIKESGNKGKPVSIKTVNLHFEFYAGLFNHAIQSRRITQSPVGGIKFSDKRDQQKLNDPFSKEDLIKLFHSDQYKRDSFKKSWMFWLPILLLYTGARLEEICQLYIEDVKEIDGFWVFDIDETRPDQKVKQHEKRYIPMHPFIIEDLRFIEYAHSLPDQKGRLFPEFKPVISKTERPDGKERLRYGHYPSTHWFPTYKKGCGIVSPTRMKTIHSFRHNISSCLMEHDVQEYVIAMVMGHKHSQISTGRYGKKFEPQQLMDKAISQLDYGIDLSHLKNSKYVIKG